MAQSIPLPQISTASAELDAIVGLGKAMGDKQRAGILQVLHEESYSVNELCQLFEVAQPALSHHLKILHQAGLVARRREGNSIFYRRAAVPDPMIIALFTGLDQSAPEPALQRRIQAIHAARRERSEEFFTHNADEIRAEQAQICETSVYADVVAELLSNARTQGGHALEVGPGSGEVLVRLARLFDTVVGIDSSRSMLEAASSATRECSNVELSHQDFLVLGPRRRFDAIVAAMVVHHQASPAGFFQQASHLLHQQGSLVVAELCLHDQQWASTACGDQWLGFESTDLHGWASSSGFEVAQSQYLAQKNGFRIQIHHYQLPDD